MRSFLKKIATDYIRSGLKEAGYEYIYKEGLTIIRNENNPWYNWQIFMPTLGSHLCEYMIIRTKSNEIVERGVLYIDG